MKNILFFVFYTFCLINITKGSVFIIGNDTIHIDNGEYYVIGIADTFYIDTTLIFVKFNSQATSYNKATIESNYHLTKEHDFTFGWSSYAYSQSNEAFIALASDLNDETLIDMVDYNTSVYYDCDELEPDDYYTDDQWYLEQISAPLAWALTTGDPEIIVAILDSGFDWEHPDLGPGDDGYDNLYYNDEENDWVYWDDPASGNKYDDDGNGCEDDWKGWGEMYDANQFPPFYLGNDVRNYDYDWLYKYFKDPDVAYTYWMHGTFIAGIIGAKTNNDGEGISGITGGWSNKGTSMLFFKTGVSDHNGSWANRVAFGIDYATHKLPHGQYARVIEMAFSAYDWQDAIKDAIEDAYENNVFLVAAAGNHLPGYPSAVTFPANHPDVFAVGATTDEDIRKSNSNYGPELDIGAPGENITGLMPDEGYQTIDGNTSAASAMVSGAAALILSMNPDLHNYEIRDIITESADKGTFYTYDENGHNDEIGYGRLNVYKAVCMAGSAAEPLEISSNETWQDNKSFMNTVEVKYGVTLTITAEIQFGPNAKLIIEPGGTIFIDGGTLTNLKCCDNEYTSWPGIEVWGDRSESQYTHFAQGHLILEDAVIENAISAAELWKPGDYDMTGGKIEATNSIFRNNAKSIHALYYTNFVPNDPNHEMDYYGTFTDCSFEIDSNYFGDQTFYKHIDLAEVKGLKFYGCTFSLSHDADNVSEWNLGIASYDAGFSISPYCTSQNIPCSTYDSCRFNGFYWGIADFSSCLTVYPVCIQAAHFDDNHTGIYISAVQNAVIINNFIEVGYDDQNLEECGINDGIGINIDGAWAFAVEDNHLRKNEDSESGYYAGIRVYKCPSDHDIIYRNDLQGLSFGNYAEETNRIDPLDDKKGVEYRCNMNDHNTVDFYVTGEEADYAMIRGDVGNYDTASGNTFSPDATLHIWNKGNQNIDWYFYDKDGLQEPKYIDGYVTPIKTSNENECPDHFGGGIELLMTEEERQQIESDFSEYNYNYNAISALYTSLIDGGNTEAELSDIHSAEPEDMWELRTQLLGISPHLSQQVLRAAATRTEVFPDEVLLEILAANPDELKKDTLISYLEQ